MKFTFDRKEIIVFLFSLAIFLLVLDIVLSKVLFHFGSQIENIDLSSLEIKNRFISGIHNFGIKDEWINEDKNGIKEGDSLKISIKVKVPKDLPIALLLNAISNSFHPGEITSFSQEERGNGTTNLFLVSGGFEKLKAEFVYNPEISRTSSSFGFLVYGLNKLDPVMQDQLIKTSELYMAVLTPSKESQEISKRLKANGKNFAILLNDDITDLDYKLANSYSAERLKMSVRSILGDFSNALAYLFDGKTGFNEESKFAFINKEFEKRNVRFLDINKFVLIDEKETSLDDSFDLIVKESNESKTDLIFISASNYIKLKPLISKYREIGYKFINPSNVLPEYSK